LFTKINHLAFPTYSHIFNRNKLKKKNVVEQNKSQNNNKISLIKANNHFSALI